MRQHPLPTAALAIVVGLFNRQAEAQDFSSEPGPISVEVVAQGLENPWGLAFLPDGRMLVTERPGRLRTVSASGELSDPIAGVPDVFSASQGGLLDVAIDPEFETNQLVYFCFAEPGDEYAGTAVARAALRETDVTTELQDTRIIFRQEPKTSTGGHFGCRLVFDRGGALFITLGDHYRSRDLAQDLNTHIGKVVRIQPDGGIPSDNPFAQTSGTKPEIWSYGHRNVQGAALHPETGELWTVEHGARGGDEINRPEAGKNYGWPVITYGRDYSGAKIGEGQVKEGMEQPIHYWDPSIAPSGMTFYTGEAFPEWRNNLFVAALKARLLARLEFKDAKVSHMEYLLKGINKRLRHVVQGPDGFLYLLTDEGDGEVLRVRPAD